MLPKLWLVTGAAILVTFGADASAEVIKVKVEQMEFIPSQVSAHVGDTIEWTNSGFLDHTATEKDDKWEVAFAPGEAKSMVLTKPGTINYYCKLHPNMTGQIIVTAK